MSDRPDFNYTDDVKHFTKECKLKMSCNVKVKKVF